MPSNIKDINVLECRWTTCIFYVRIHLILVQLLLFILLVLLLLVVIGYQRLPFTSVSRLTRHAEGFIIRFNTSNGFELQTKHAEMFHQKYARNFSNIINKEAEQNRKPGSNFITPIVALKTSYTQKHSPITRCASTWMKRDESELT